MVAKITMPQSIIRALNYNEKKVGKGQAEFIYAGNFLKDAEQLNFHDKLNHFKKLMALNERAKTNTLHISLNFHPSEKLNKKTLVQIASSYMEKIGFGKQPFLVYEHHDAGHPHIHLVTTNIKADGSRIPIHNIGRNQSSKARVEIEQEFELVKATGRSQQQLQQKLQPVNTQKVLYGKAETKQSIMNVLDAVLNTYKYTSLNQLNAVLQLYNVKAEQGDKEGRIFKNNGLFYRILDEKGNAVGVPVKASSIYNKPTLNYLEGKFVENKQRRQLHEKRLKTVVDWTLAKHPDGLKNFILALEKEKVNTIVRRNEQGFVFGLTFIDHQTKSVFNGSDLGKSYSAKTVLERCGQQQKQLPVLSHRKEQKEFGGKRELLPNENTLAPYHITPAIFINMVEAIVKPEEQQGQVVSPQRRKKRKKKKGLSTH